MPIGDAMDEKPKLGHNLGSMFMLDFLGFLNQIYLISLN